MRLTPNAIRIGAAAFVALGCAATLCGDTPAPTKEKPNASAKQFADQVRPFLVRHCMECHGGKEKPKGDFRLDDLTEDFDNPIQRDRWLAVLKRVQAGEMPPKAKPRPPEKESQALVSWVRGQADAASARRAAAGRVVLRR